MGNDMNNHNIDSRDNLLSDIELAATRGGDIMAPGDPSFIAADGPQDKPRDPKTKYTAAQLAWIHKWLSHIH
jgi:hypothetical protein